LLRQLKNPIENTLAGFGIDADGQCAQIHEKSVGFLPADAAPPNGSQEGVSYLRRPMGWHDSFTARS
jgi:hypothetical protein